MFHRLYYLQAIAKFQMKLFNAQKTPVTNLITGKMGGIAKAGFEPTTFGL